MIVSQRIIDLLQKVEKIEKKLQEEDALKDRVDDRGLALVGRNDAVKERSQ